MLGTDTNDNGFPALAILKFVKTEVFNGLLDS
jgi:hypothetical protein